MWYMDAVRLVELCIEHEILKTAEGGVLLYITEMKEKPEGWYVFSKEQVAHQLMEDVDGIHTLTNALADLGVEFQPNYPTHEH